VFLDGSVKISDNTASIGGGVHLLGYFKMVVKGDTVFENNTAGGGPDLHVGALATLSIESSNLDLYGSTVLWQRTDCMPGEVLDQGYCGKCLPSTYSLVPGPGGVCQVCPENAVCATGGDSIVPHAGFWHSGQYSTQMHRCVHLDEVCGPDSTCAAGYGGTCVADFTPDEVCGSSGLI